MPASWRCPLRKERAMNRTAMAVVGGLVALGLLIVLLSGLFAQRYAPPERRPGEVGRYVVVRSSADVIVIMDTTTGDLYNAVPSDIKPYASRHRLAESPPPGPDKGAPPPRDKGA